MWPFFGGILFGIILGGIIVYSIQEKKIFAIRCISDKHLSMFLLLNRWMQNRNQGKTIGEYLENRGIQDVVIYGMSYMGKLLYEELQSADFEIKDLVDQRKNLKIDDREVKVLGEKVNGASLVVVTAIYYFEEIEERLKESFKVPIVSLEDIIYKM